MNVFVGSKLGSGEASFHFPQATSDKECRGGKVLRKDILQKPTQAKVHHSRLVCLQIKTKQNKKTSDLFMVQKTTESFPAGNLLSLPAISPAQC